MDFSSAPGQYEAYPAFRGKYIVEAGGWYHNGKVAGYFWYSRQLSSIMEVQLGDGLKVVKRKAVSRHIQLGKNALLLITEPCLRQRYSGKT